MYHFYADDVKMCSPLPTASSYSFLETCKIDPKSVFCVLRTTRVSEVVPTLYRAYSASCVQWIRQAEGPYARIMSYNVKK